MGAYLLEAQRRATLPELAKTLTTSSQWELDRKSMNAIVEKGNYILLRQSTVNITYNCSYS